MTLIILHNDGSESLRADIGDRDPTKVTVAVLQVIDSLPKPRKPRSDAGKPRLAGKAAGADGQE